MKVLVTGGAGFIGSHLVERLLATGHGVTVLDDLSTGKLENLPHAGDIELVTGDVADLGAVATAMNGIDAVVHLAAVASVAASVLDPLGTSRTNLTGSLTVFQAAAAAGVKRLVYASSASVYGDPETVPLSEDAPKRPLSPYAVDKLAGEHYLAHFHRTGHLDAATFRFFNVYGPRQDPSSPYSGVISIFMERSIRRQPLTIFGDGQQTRDFVYVADVVDVLARAVEESTETATGSPEALTPINLGRGEAVSLLELIDTIGSVVGGAAPAVTFEPARSGDIRHSLADVSALALRYGRPATTLSDGLTATLAATLVG